MNAIPTKENETVVRELARLWLYHFNRELPPASFFTNWKRFDFTDVDFAFQVGESWVSKRPESSTLHLACYVSGVLRNIRKDLEILQKVQKELDGVGHEDTN